MARERGLQDYTRVVSSTEIAVQAVALDAQGKAGSSAVGRLAAARSLTLGLLAAAGRVIAVGVDPGPVASR